MSPPWNKHSCAVPSCTSALRKAEPDLSWHGFPKREAIHNGWLRIVRSLRSDPNWSPNPDTKICSRHFPAEQRTGGVLKRLVSNALPSVNLLADKTEESSITEFEPPTSLQLQETSTASDSGDGINASSFSESMDVVGEVEIQDSTETIESPMSETRNLGAFVLAACPNCKCEFQVNIPKTDGTPKRRKAPTPRILSSVLSPKSAIRCRSEHSYYRSPTSTASLALKRNLALKRKLRTANQAVSRKKLALTSISDQLKDSKMISSNKIDILQNEFPNLLKEIIQTEIQTINKSKKGVRYSEEMKKFAVTLHYYSPKAYDFVRDYLTLPHRSSLTAWMSSGDNEPGFNLELIKQLGEAVKQDERNMMRDVGLQVDEMAIKKGTVWDSSRNQFVGFVDFGGGKLTGDEPLATNAMVLLVAGLSGGWKVPIGYVFTDKVNASQMTQFVSRGLELTYNHGLIVHTVTSDGNTANVKMFDMFGINESAEVGPSTYDQIVNDFPHPCDEKLKVGAVYDVVHMMKLWRNLLAQCCEIEWEEGKIEWRYIVDLFNLQQSEKIVAANKLSKNHIDFERNKMKVKYVVQVFSSSCADAIDFCRVDLGLSQFKNSEATSSFIRQLDQVFDILNSRHPAERGSKSPIKSANYQDKAHVLVQFARKILKAKYMEKRTCKGKTTFTPKLLVQSNRKRAVLGTVISIKSILTVCNELLFRPEKPFRYVLTYRFCQDLIELLFNKIRQRCGGNNSPNCLEFINIMKKLYHHNNLKSTSTGNCVMQVKEGEVPGGLLPLKRSKPKLSEEFDPLDVLPDFTSHPDGSMFYKNCIAYIAGNVVKKMTEKLDCSECVSLLHNCEMDKLDPQLSKLIDRKTRGGLLFPCNSVYQIVLWTDDIFWNLVKIYNGPPRIQKLNLKIVNQVTSKCLERNIFPQFGTHTVDFNPFDEESHLSVAIKSIVKYFLTVRLHDYSKRYQRNLTVSLRNHSLKLTHFRHE